MTTDRSTRTTTWWPWVVVFLALMFVGFEVFVAVTRDETAESASGTREDESGADRTGSRRSVSAWQAPADAGDGTPAVGATGAAKDIPDAANAAAPDELAATATVRGRVIDGRGRGVASVAVDLWDAQGVFLDAVDTDVDGAFAFASDDPLEAGWIVSVDPGGLRDDGDHLLGLACYRHDEDLNPGDPPVVCALAYRRAARLVGRVVDQATGAPVAGADIELVTELGPWEDDYTDAVSRSDGWYELAVVDFPSQGLFVRVLDDDDRASFVGPIAIEPGGELELDLIVRQPWQLTGSVLDEATASPIGGASVSWLAPRSVRDPDDVSAVTSGDGSFELDDVPPGADGAWMLVSAPGYGAAVVSVIEPSRPLVVRLGAPPRLVGHVRAGPSQAPLAAVRVRFALRHPDGHRTGLEHRSRTDGAGRLDFALEAIPADYCDVLVEARGEVVVDGPLSGFARDIPGLGSVKQLSIVLD